MKTLDQIKAIAEASKGPPLRPVPMSDPTDAEAKILMSVQFMGSFYETKGEMGRLQGFASRLRYELQKMQEVIDRA